MMNSSGCTSVRSEEVRQLAPRDAKIAPQQRAEHGARGDSRSRALVGDARRMTAVAA